MYPFLARSTVEPSISLPELLAPAGGPEALRAAVAGGADAVYLGVDRLNARRGAENFTIETLADACRFAHLRGVRIYLTANVVILPEEMQDAVTLVDEAWTAGVDAVIVQDPGLLAQVRELMPHVRIHASTQMNAHSTSTVEAIAKMGAARVTLSRETSLAEIAELSSAARRAGAQTESFVHGAICVCYSGQCLLSSLIGGRSANRGMCAQPCRMTYELVDGSGSIIAVPGAHLLSPKDLAGIGVLPQLIESGVSSLKIEGRMKSAEYVAVVTGVYRSALDRAASAPDAYEVRDGEMNVLAEAFSRGFSSAYLTGERGNAMMGYRRPNNRGVGIGRISAITGDIAEMTLEAALSGDDLLEIWTNQGRITQDAGPITVGADTLAEAPAGARVKLRLQGPAAAGDRVFRVRNAALARAAERTYQEAEPADLPVSVEVSMVIGEPVRVRITDSKGRVGEASGAQVETARTRAVTADDVTQHVGRLGGTPYRPESWDVRLSPGAGIGFSELHRVRREAADALSRAILETWEKRALVRPHVTVPQGQPGRPVTAPRLVAVAADVDAARACLAAGADEVHVASMELGSEATHGVVRLLSRVSHDPEERASLARVSEGTAVVASTLGALCGAAKLGARVQAHWSMNACNPWAVAEFSRLGASMIWLSPELTGRQIGDIAASSEVPVGIAISGRQEVMVTEHCVLMAEGECDRRCAACSRRSSTRLLRDRKGYEFPIRTDVMGRTHLYNSVPLDLTYALDQVLETGVAALRMDLETETTNSAAEETARVRRALDAALAGAPLLDGKRSQTTSGHFFRGVR